MLISEDPDREAYEHHQRNGVEEMSVLGFRCHSLLPNRCRGAALEAELGL
jgi:hypothetical protein